MKKILQCMILLILISVLVLSGCTTTQTNTPTSNNQDSSSNVQTQPKTADSGSGLRSSNAKFIGNFMATADEKVVETRFSLLDDSNKYVTADGTGSVRIENSEGDKVYTSTINPKKEDFGTYTLMLTGEQFEAYVWEIPLTEIKKSTSLSGTIYLNFKTGDAEFEEMKTDIWGLPTYNEKELAELNEQSFSKNAIDVNKKLSKGNFEVTVQRVGLFNPMVTYGEPEEYFRMDMEVKNIGDEKEYFSPSGLAILDNQGNQFEREYGGTLDTFSEIYPGVKKNGYILFKNIPITAQTIKLVFELGHDANYDAYSYEYNIPLTK